MSTNMYLFRRTLALESQLNEIKSLLGELTLTIAQLDEPAQETFVRLKREAPASSSTALSTGKSRHQRGKRSGENLESEREHTSFSVKNASISTGLGFSPLDAANGGFKAVQFRPCLKSVVVSDSTGK